jgi:hypothetical protein
VVRGASALLRRPRALALAGLTVALGAYQAGAGRLWDVGFNADVAFLAAVLFPATLLVAWLALPLQRERWLAPAGLALVVLAVLFRAADLAVLFNLAKLLALVALGFWFLSYFETVAWAVLIAVVIPWIDALSVWRGPTDYVVSEQPGLFEDVSVEFRHPGEEASANLGPPDFLFFSLFLAAADRFGLRVVWTWLAMVALLSATLVLTATTDVAGLPALPAICIGFLLPNADLIWRALRRRGRAPVRIYGRTDAEMFDVDADLLERTPGRIVLLTRDRPPRDAEVSFEDGRGTLTIADAAPVAVTVHDLPHGVVVVPYDEDPTFVYDVHPEQLAADDAKVERLVRERS